MKLQIAVMQDSGHLVSVTSFDKGWEPLPWSILILIYCLTFLHRQVLCNLWQTVQRLTSRNTYVTWTAVIATDCAIQNCRSSCAGSHCSAIGITLRDRPEQRQRHVHKVQQSVRLSKTDWTYKAINLKQCWVRGPACIHLTRASDSISSKLPLLTAFCYLHLVTLLPLNNS